MSSITLYHFPGACSQVTLCALEHAGLPYTLELVNLAKGQQSTPEYMAISPLGKVPTMVVDGDALTENAALLVYIALLKPEAGLFPANPTPRRASDIQAGLSFCGGTLHPQIRGVLNPQRLTDGETEGVRSRSTELAKKSFGYAEKRLADNGWWLGEWSIIDVYLNWAFSVARTGGFDVGPFPLLNGLAEKLSTIPAFARMQALEAENRAKLGL